MTQYRLAADFRRPYFRNGEIEDICLDELQNSGFLPSAPTPIRVDRFIEKRFDVVPDYRNLHEGVLGVTEFRDGRAVGIVVARSLDNEGTQVSDRRIRTTLAHEAGHALLHAHLFAKDCKTAPLLGDWTHADAPRVLCRDIEPAPSKQRKGVWSEYQANQAIAGLLLPRPLVDMVLAPYVVTTVLGLRRLDLSKAEYAERDLSEVFDVNPVVARIHLKKLFPDIQNRQLALT